MQNPAHRQLLTAEQAAHEQEESTKKRYRDSRRERVAATRDLNKARRQRDRQANNLSATKSELENARRLAEQAAQKGWHSPEHMVRLGELILAELAFARAEASDAQAKKACEAAERRYRATDERYKEDQAEYNQAQIDHDIAIGELDDFEHGRMDMFELGLAA